LLDYGDVDKDLLLPCRAFEMTAISNGSKTKGRNEWWTPTWFIEALFKTRPGPCVLDCAASSNNSVAPAWMGRGGVAEDALAVDWYENFEAVLPGHCQYRADGSILTKPYQPWAFCNPPWDQIDDFLAKASELADKKIPVVYLLPARCSEGWSKHLRQASKIEMITPRLNYYDPVADKLRNGIAVGSMLVTYNGSRAPTSFAIREFRKPKGAVR
jgi:phage N-6-adenine-methyltransferase